MPHNLATDENGEEFCKECGKRGHALKMTQKIDSSCVTDEKYDPVTMV